MIKSSTIIRLIFSIIFYLNIVIVQPLLSFQDNEKKEAAADSTVLWEKSLSAKFSLNQSSYSNWQKGGDNSFAWGVLIVFDTERETKNFKFSNSGKFSFGKTKISGQEARKSLDQIFFESVFSNKKKYRTFFISFKAETQFDVGKKYTENKITNVSNVIDPLFLFQSAGYSFNAGKTLKFRQGLSLKETVTREYPFWSDNPDTEEIENYRFERGFEFEAILNATLMKNVTINSKLNLFSTMKSLKTTDLKSENHISAKVNKYISADFQYFLVYDRDFSPKVQVFQSIAMSLSFTFI